jgi:hypothetical protein
MKSKELKLSALSGLGHRQAFLSNDGDRYEGEISGVENGRLQMYVGEQRANRAFRVNDVDMSSLAYYDEQAKEWIDMGLEHCLFGD